MQRESHISMNGSSDSVSPHRHPAYPPGGTMDADTKACTDAVPVPKDRTSPVSAGGGSGGTGRRSPTTFLERTTAIRFVHKATGKLMCSKLSRVVRTKAPRENDVCLCESFLRGSCEDGGRCHLAHVPRQCLWNFLVPRVDPKFFTYKEGFSVCCYNPTMTSFYHIPSEYILQTRGSERYIELYNDNGDNFKEKLRLCTAMTNEGFCAAGYDCEDVHCSVADLSQFPCIHTHIATEEGVHECERLPADVVVLAYLPNSGAAETRTYTGDDVLRTVGATQYEEAYRREGGVPSVKMQHCAHFQNKKMCRLGDGCRFLHVVSLALSTPAQDESGADGSGSRRLSQLTSPLTSPIDSRLQPTTMDPNMGGLGGIASVPPTGAPARPIAGRDDAPSRAMKNGAALMAIAGFINGDSCNSSGNTASTPLGPVPTGMTSGTAGGSGGYVSGTSPIPGSRCVLFPVTEPMPMANATSLNDPRGSPSAIVTFPIDQTTTTTAAAASNGNVPQRGERRSPVRRHNPYALSPNGITL